MSKFKGKSEHRPSLVSHKAAWLVCRSATVCAETHLCMHVLYRGTLSLSLSLSGKPCINNPSLAWKWKLKWVVNSPSFIFHTSQVKYQYTDQPLCYNWGHPLVPPVFPRKWEHNTLKGAMTISFNFLSKHLCYSRLQYITCRVDNAHVSKIHTVCLSITVCILETNDDNSKG
jgi:hypothetical protein